VVVEGLFYAVALAVSADMTKILPYGHQTVDAADIAAVSAVLQSDFLTCGPVVDEFERRFSERVDAKYAVAVNSATAALHLAMRVAKIGPGDRVISSPNTFLASANCAAYVGAIPDFSDIDSVSYNLDAGSLKRNWQPDIKAVVATDYAGQSCDFPTIAEIARKRSAVVIEDASHAVGGAFDHEGKLWKIGGHPWADMTVFSFHPVKTMDEVLAQATGKRFGLLQTMLYAGAAPGAAAPGFNDIVQGNNGAYKAGPGWDACTGLGSPNGAALLHLLSGTTPTAGG